MNAHCDVAIANLDYQRSEIAARLRRIRIRIGLGVTGGIVATTATVFSAGSSDMDADARGAIAAGLGGAGGLLGVGSYVADFDVGDNGATSDP